MELETNMTTLSSQYTSYGNMEVVEVELDGLRCMVEPPEQQDFYDKLKIEISNDGYMLDPILIVPFSKERLDHMISNSLFRGLKGILKENPPDWDNLSEVMVVMKGNNRVLIAKELGHDKINAVIMKTDDVVGVGRVMKKSKTNSEIRDERL